MSLCDGILTVFEVTPSIQEPVSIKLIGMQNIFYWHMIHSEKLSPNTILVFLVDAP